MGETVPTAAKPRRHEDTKVRMSESLRALVSSWLSRSDLISGGDDDRPALDPLDGLLGRGFDVRLVGSPNPQGTYLGVLGRRVLSLPGTYATGDAAHQRQPG